MPFSRLETLPPTEILQLENGLSLRSRLRFNLTVYPADSAAATKPVDEWNLKRALLEFLKSSFSISLTVPEDDLLIRRSKDLKNRRRDDALASGTLFVRDLKFLERGEVEEHDDELRSNALQRKLSDWRDLVLDKMNGIELNLEGFRYKLSVETPDCDDFDKMRKAWEESSAFENRGRGIGRGKQEIDTIVVRGVPSRWFSEPRVSSRPSMLVTHTIFSAFGRIRNLEVVEDDEQGRDGKEEGGLISGLHCKVVVQYEKYRDFCNAFKVLCGRSLQKNGSRFEADYEVTWAKDVNFRNAKSREAQNSSGLSMDAFRSNASMQEPIAAAKETRRKRFRE